MLFRSIQISILQASETGTVIYRETHNPISNKNGLVTLEIGSGINRFGQLESINWANGPFFLLTEVDPSGGFNYTISGTSQFLSVPFAFHAKTAESISGANTFLDSIAQLRTEISNLSALVSTEAEPIFNGSVAAGITQADTAAWNAASKGSFDEADPAFTAWDKSIGITITKSQITDLSFDIFEKELTDNENYIDVGFGLVSTSEIFINGIALPNGEWSGIGTQILNFNIQTKLYDKLKVKK